MSGTTTHIQFGDGLDVTDEGGGTIRVDGSGGPAGPAGAPGPAGPTGATGATGPAGPNLVNDSTSSPLTGILRGNGTDIDVATPADVLAAAGLGKSARVSRLTNQTLTNNAFTTLLFDREDWDTDNMHDLTANTDRITIQTAGLYLLIAEVQLAVNTGGTERTLRLLVDGSIVSNRSSAPGSRALAADTVWNMSVGRIAQAAVFQDSGGPLDAQAVGNAVPYFTAVRLG